MNNLTDTILKDKYILLGYLSSFIDAGIVPLDELSPTDIITLSGLSSLQFVWEKFCNILYRYREDIGNYWRVLIEIEDMEVIIAHFKQTYELRYRPIDLQEEL